MAFPVIENTANSSDSGTSHVVDLPSGITTGELLLVFVTVQDSTCTFPGGWTSFVSSGGSVTLNAAWRVADETEGASITITTGLSRASGHQSYRISGAEDPNTQEPEEGTIVSGSATSANVGSNTPTGGSKDYLWISWLGLVFARTITAPTNYTTLLQSDASGECATCRRNLTAASEDPDTFDWSSTVEFRCVVVAVHPATPSSPLTPSKSDSISVGESVNPNLIIMPQVQE